MNSLPLRLLFASLALTFASSAPLHAAEKIGVLLKGTSGFWRAMGQGATEAGSKLGAEVIVKMPPAETDTPAQIKMLNDLLAQGITALVIAPCSSSALSEPVAAAAAKGVKIVVIDTPLDGEMPVFIATNHTNAGDAAGRLLASLVTESDKVAILKHAQSNAATTLRELSAYAALHFVHPAINVSRDIFSSNEPGHEVEKAHLLLTQHPQVKGILASSTPSTMAMMQALQETKQAGTIRFVGFGFNLDPVIAAALENGTMDGWIAQLPGEVGRRGVTAALALIAGKPTPEVSFCDFLVITKANLHEPSVQALLP